MLEHNMTLLFLITYGDKEVTVLFAQDLLSTKKDNYKLNWP